MQEYSFRRLKKILLLNLARFQMPGAYRAKMLKLGGIDIPNTLGVSIGEGCILDRLYPQNIHIGHHVRITMNCVILTHYFDSSFPRLRFNSGHVYIGNNVFIGAGTIICNSVKIGDNAIVGAGSIVTRNIPSGEIWGGNPARFIKKRPGYEDWGDKPAY